MIDTGVLNRRILVIDDSPSVIEDYRKVLLPTENMTAVQATRATLFSGQVGVCQQEPFVVDVAEQGSIGCALVEQSITQGMPYAVAFVDMRMPPGWDGVETIERMWAIDPAIQTVICTAYSDHEWSEVIHRLGHRDQLLILRKPFDAIEVLQMANSLTYKWHWACHARFRLGELERLVDQRMTELRDANVQLEHDVLRRQSIESQLAQSVRDLEQRNRELSEARDQALIEVHERERADLALRHKTEELVRSNHELDQFASVAAHDLQEPLHTIQVFSDLLRVKCGQSLPSSGSEFLHRILKASSRMQRLIQDLLVYSRLEHQDRVPEPVALREVVEDILSDFAVRIDEQQARIEVGELPVIESDPTHIRQLLQNLIGNALKFHKPDEPPVIRLSACLMKERRHKDGQHADQLCQLCIEDEGIGMDAQYTDRIFGMFKRLHGRDEFEGTGIGLAVCKKIVDRCGGHITVQSEVGKGSTFLVTLPMGNPLVDYSEQDLLAVSTVADSVRMSL
ncbi:MAG: ATP-binding protein [Nitrospirales bacterium]